MTDFERLEALILSGQVPDSEIQKLIRDIPGFGRWWRTRAAARQVA